MEAKERGRRETENELEKEKGRNGERQEQRTVYMQINCRFLKKEAKCNFGRRL